MSANDSGNGRLAPRVVRVRNHCLAVLAARRSLPLPSRDDLAAIGDGVGLSEAWTRWQQIHASSLEAGGVAPRPALRTPPRWRSPLVVKAAALVLTAFLGFVVGERWLPKADAQASAGSIAPPWEPVTESALSTLNTKLLAASASEVRPRLELSSSEMAALILRSRRRALAPMSGIEARSDSLLWIQGRLGAGSTFEVGGDLRIVRRGLAELRVTHLNVDGRDVDPRSVSRTLARYQPDAGGTNRLRFNVPWFVTGLVPHDGAVEVIAAPIAERAGGRVSP
jgi:hypothetical protein